MPNSPPCVSFAIVIPKFSGQESQRKFKKNSSNIWNARKEHVSFPDNINSNRQLFDRIRRRIGLSYLEILKNQDGKLERGDTVMSDSEKSKMSDAQTMSGLNRGLASPLTF